MSLRETILQAQDYEKEEVKVPEWGTTIYVRSMTARHADDIQIWFARFSREPELGQGRINDPEKLRDLKVTLVSYCLSDEYGNLLFDDDEGREILRNKSSIVIDRLYDLGSMINKLGEEAELEEKKD